MSCADRSGLMTFISLPLRCGEFGHPRFFGILLDLGHCCLTVRFFCLILRFLCLTLVFYLFLISAIIASMWAAMLLNFLALAGQPLDRY